MLFHELRYALDSGDTLASDVVFQLRTDPTTGRKVLIAEGRALRPTDFEEARPVEAHATENCPFCPGNEHATPHELAAIYDTQGHWQVRVVPNKYPALASGRESSLVAETDAGQCPPPTGSALGWAEPPDGVHEVIIESARHVRDWAELTTAELTTVLRAFQRRIEHACNVHQMKSALVFKNVGHAAGASLEHVHSQLVAFAYVPEVLDRELQLAAAYRTRTGQCLMCSLVDQELTERARVVTENEHFVAFTAVAGRQPYESWVVPRQHASHYNLMASEESASLAEILGDLVRRLGSIIAGPAYNVVLHTAPVGDERSAAFHWHWEVIPRTTALAGFEWGTGMYINSVSPERAAIQLSALKSGKGLPIQ